MSSWEIEYTDQFRTWWDDLTEAQQNELAKKVEYLSVHGPNAKRPAVAEVDGSTIKNLKELRADMADAALRVLFVFDPTRTAILLVGGDKAEGSAWSRWYRGAIAEAEALYADHLDELKAEGLL